MTALAAAVERVALTLLGTGLAIAAVAGAAVVLSIAALGFGVSGALSLYFVVWWTLLFAVLPFGAGSQAAAGEIVAGSEPGAPASPGLNEKAIWTTLISDVVFILVTASLPLAGL